ncbi:DMT family transporter [Defluviimonas sp. WL0050]|uniref:DMT family transporter n=2 Tax=Albidovulum litorale TaxID=2984134 RepID=A0ABT2ZR32_9RHOB|nr:DMT family transporter [Defluviimonas sp. WL0050]MCV2873593.1 DMT family transporter [Defluviimonas sp. WL0050]
MADAVSRAGMPPRVMGSSLAAPLLLVAVGSLIATAVALSKLAAAAGAPMLGYLGAVWVGAGAMLIVPVLIGRGVAGLGQLMPYSFGAGALMMAPSAAGYLAVGHVGAGFVSLTFAFPVLITWVIARGLRMDGARRGQGLGVSAALVGGVVLASGKLAETGGPGDGALWVGVAATIPAALALGNIFRTRFWPVGEAPLTLAALSVLIGAALVLPLAMVSEGSRLSVLWTDHDILLLILTGSAVVAAQYVLQFRLQALAGPVYMSQIGGVAAMVGAVLAVVVLGEALPPAFWPAVMLIVAGTVLFQRAAMQHGRP